MPNRSEAEHPLTGLEEAAAPWTPAGDRSSAAQLTDAQQEQVRELRAQALPTRRAVVPALEEILYQPLPVLDRGFVRVIDYMGDDAAIVQAARVSYGRGTKKVSDDRGLINYLMRMRHTSPFEMCELKLHVKLPIFVARQWIRHRTANVNEYSARYSVLEDEFYVPAPEHVASQASSNRQGRDQALDPAQAAAVQDTMRKNAERAYADYLALLNQDASGEPVDARARGPGARARPHRAAAQHLHRVVLEDRPAQPAALHRAARRRARPVRDPRLRPGAPGRGPALDAADLRGVRGLPPACGGAVGQGARGAAPDARGRDRDARRTAGSARASGASCRRT